MAASESVGKERVDVARRNGRRRIGILIAACAAVLAAAFLAPARFPDTFGLAMPFEAALPWLGILVVLLLIAALARRAWLGILVSLVAVAAWSWVFVPRILPLEPVAMVGNTETVSVLSQNVRISGGDTAGARAAAEKLRGEDADLLALQEIAPEQRETVAGVLRETYPYEAHASTVGLWSRYPILDSEPLDLGLGWDRALRATIATPGGDTEVYVVHAASARIDGHAPRDEMLAELADEIRNDGSPRIIAAGDFNASSDDRSFVPLRELLAEPRQGAGGFGFSWPAQFPVVRLDHILLRGFDAREMTTVPLGDSDHLAVSAVLRPSA